MRNDLRDFNEANLNAAFRSFHMWRRDIIATQVIYKDAGSFARLELVPREGWVHLATDSELAVQMAAGWRYHISLTRIGGGCGTDLLNGVASRWACRDHVLRVNRVTPNGVAVVALDDSLYGDAGVFEAYKAGSYRAKWHDSRFGLHVSM